MNLRWKIITPLSRAEVEIVKPIVRPLGRQRVQRISNLSIHKSGDQNGESACSLPRLSLTKLLVSFGLLASVLVSIFMPSRAIASPDTTYAVLFSGGLDAANNHDRYYEETLRMWNISVGLFGVNNVFVLFADGLAPAVDRSSGVSSDWTPITNAGGNIEAATHDNLFARLTALSSVITPQDSFYFWSFNHGDNPSFPDCPNEAPNAPNSPILNKANPPGCLPPVVANPNDVVLTAWQAPSIRDDELAAWVAPINAKKEAYAFAECFSGGMVDDLFPDPNRFAAWAAAANECSFDRGWADAWADAIEAGLRSTWKMGEFARVNDPFGGGPAINKETPGWTGANFHFLTNESVPEPSTFALFLISLLGITLCRRERRKGTL